MIKFCFYIILIFLITFSSIFAVDGNGQLSSEVYFFEQDSIKHTRLYQSFRFNLNLWQQSNKKVTLQNYTRWTTDFDNKYSSDPQLFVYNAIIRFKNIVPKSNVLLGRQFVYTSIGSDLIDGVNITNYSIPNLRFQIFGGVKVDRLNPETFVNSDENKVAGVQTFYSFSRKYKIGFNWFARIQDKKIIYNRLGFNSNINYNRSRLYARVTIDPNLLTLNEILVRAEYNYIKWRVGLEYLYREPFVTSNSIFAIINVDPYNRLRFNTQYKFNKRIRLIGNINYSLYEQENSLSGSVGIRASIFSLFYNFQDGRGGDRNGISGSIFHSINDRFTVYGSANVSRYRVQTEQDDLNDAYSTSLGIIGRIDKTWQIRTEWQYLRNAIEESSSRIYLRINKQFSLGK
jgi:hypothetical protein